MTARRVFITSCNPLSLVLSGCGRLLAEGTASDASLVEAGVPGQEAGFDATAEAAMGGGSDTAPPLLPAPRPLAPLSTSRVTSRRPTLRWVLPQGGTSATVDLCRDRLCTMPVGTSARVEGESYAPPDDLPVGVVFWRLHPASEARVTSPTWQFTVGAGSAPVDTSWGTTLDVNGDGYADVLVSAGDSSSDYVLLYLGSATGLATTPATILSDPGSSAFGPQAGDAFGNSIASAGDVDGDGYADVIVGAFATSYASEDGGVSYSAGGAYVA
jgi:hypothetical protein